MSKRLQGNLVKIKEHIPKSCKMSNKEQKSKKVVNASKRSAVAEHLFNNLGCASYYILKRFKIFKTYFNIFDLIKPEAKCILIKNLSYLNI